RCRQNHCREYAIQLIGLRHSQRMFGHSGIADYGTREMTIVDVRPVETCVLMSFSLRVIQGGCQLIHINDRCGPLLAPVREQTARNRITKNEVGRPTGWSFS